MACLVPQVSSHVTQVSRDRVRQVAAGPASCIVVARVGGQVVGSAALLTLVTLVGSFGYLEEVVVDTSMRGRRIGRQLVAGVVDVARSKGLDFVELTSQSSRESANALYQSCHSPGEKQTSTGLISAERRSTRAHRRRHERAYPHSSARILTCASMRPSYVDPLTRWPPICGEVSVSEMLCVVGV